MDSTATHPATLTWVGDVSGRLRMIDQTLLPVEFREIDCETLEQVWEAIKSLRVRGAPAIGVAAGYGVVIGLQNSLDCERAQFDRQLQKVTDYLATSRPTAVNHFLQLPNLNARFADHTLKLFEKHGIKNVMYSTPVGKGNTLVYVIAHKDRETANKSWKAFGQDPAWKKVAKESQQDGRILVKGGVKRVYLKTTDYSPNK